MSKNIFKNIFLLVHPFALDLWSFSSLRPFGGGSNLVVRPPWQSNWVNSLGQFSNFHSVQQTASHRCHKSWKMIGLSRSIFQSLQHPWLAHLLDKMEVEKEITRSESSDVLSCGNRRFTRKSILLSFEGSLRIIDPTWAIFIILIYVYKQLW